MKTWMLQSVLAVPQIWRYESETMGFQMALEAKRGDAGCYVVQYNA